MNRHGLFIFSIAFIIGFSQPTWAEAAPASCESAANFNGEVCWLLIASNSMNGEAVAVKVFIPSPFAPQAFLFLHGKGYTRDYQSTVPTMIENMGGTDWIAQRQQQGLPAPIIVAPQDNFIHMVNGEPRAGRDYWIGTEGRDWSAFFRKDLIPSINDLWSSPQTPLTWKTSGISMGAHGALRLGWLDPQLFTAIASISPIFRSTETQMQDVASFQDRQENSIGFELVHAQTGNDCSLVPNSNHLVRIHSEDFGYRNFHENPALFAFIERCSVAPDAQVTIDRFPIESSDGHSSEYWQEVLPETFDWLFQQTSNIDIRI